eukprot:6400393-Amphidinium_carterae.1
MSLLRQHVAKHFAKLYIANEEFNSATVKDLLEKAKAKNAQGQVFRVGKGEQPTEETNPDDDVHVACDTDIAEAEDNLCRKSSAQTQSVSKQNHRKWRSGHCSDARATFAGAASNRWQAKTWRLPLPCELLAKRSARSEPLHQLTIKAHHGTSAKPEIPNDIKNAYNRWQTLTDDLKVQD